jgi:hypothetical protein
MRELRQYSNNFEGAVEVVTGCINVPVEMRLDVLHDHQAAALGKDRIRSVRMNRSNQRHKL